MHQRQKEGFAQAAATGNALLVRVKDNQPTLHATLAGLCATGCPFDSYKTVDRRRHGRQEHRHVEVFDTNGGHDIRRMLDSRLAIQTGNKVGYDYLGEE